MYFGKSNGQSQSILSASVDPPTMGGGCLSLIAGNIFASLLGNIFYFLVKNLPSAISEMITYPIAAFAVYIGYSAVNLIQLFLSVCGIIFTIMFYGWYNRNYNKWTIGIILIFVQDVVIDSLLDKCRNLKSVLSYLICSAGNYARRIIMSKVWYGILFIIGVIFYGIILCVPTSLDEYIDYWKLVYIMMSDGYFPMGKFTGLILFPGICSYTTLSLVKRCVIAYYKNGKSLDKMYSVFVDRILD